MLSEALKPVAKAVAGVVTPFVVAGVAKLAEKAGIDVPVDPDLVSTSIVAVVTGAAVYFTRNRSKELEAALAELERLRRGSGG